MSRSGKAILATVFLIIFVCSATVSAAEKKVYTLAVIPNMPAMTLHKNWTPFADYLSEKLGIRIELKIYDKIGTFLAETEDGKADFIYSAPNMFYQAYQKQEYIPLVRSSTMMRGVVFVRKDSPYRTVRDLQGKSIAFVGPKNVCSVLTRHAMTTGQGRINFNASYNGSTVNVAKIVQLGKADAGGTLDISMMSDVPEMANEFRTILETNQIASHPLAAHPRVPAKLREAFSKTVLAMDTSEQGRKILQTVKISKPIRADFKRDYSFFAQFDLDLLDKQQAN